MGAQRILEWLCFIGLFCLIFNTGITTLAQTQTKRSTSGRFTSSRSSFGTNVKYTTQNSNGLNFECPEEFGYYPHPTDCSQYYVCVFGGALLESCTGGLMYSHELQTCDWPRNVGCEIVDNGSSASNSNSQRETGSRSIKQQSATNNQQHVPNKVRFGSAFTSSATASTSTATNYEKVKPTVPQQYHRQPPQAIQAQVQKIPPPPELKVPPNPVITSRGQPRPLLDSQEDIAKLYADAHDTLPPLEEEETDRQQRVYRGQPSTVSQVQRDRDGIIHQASLNAIPSYGKSSSFAFGSQYSQNFLGNDQKDKIFKNYLKTFKQSDKQLQRKRLKRELKETTTAEVITESKISDESELNTTRVNTTILEHKLIQLLNLNESQLIKDLNKPSNIDSNTSSEIFDATDVKTEANTTTNVSDKAKDLLEIDYMDTEDPLPSESVCSTRQLRAFSNARSRWPSHVKTNYRSIDSNHYHQQHNFAFGPFNPYLTPPTTSPYSQLSPGYQPYQTLQQPIYNQKPKVRDNAYNPPLPTPPIEDDFRPIAGNYYNGGNKDLITTTPRPNYFKNPDLLPYLLQSIKDYKEQRKKQQLENFSYFHLENPPLKSSVKPIPHVHTTENTPVIQHQYYQQTTKPQTEHSQKATPNSHYLSYSTVGGFYNNQPVQNNQHFNTETSLEFKPTLSAGKLVSHYSIGENQNPAGTTESNYFQYNILANQRIKAYHNTVKPFMADVARYTTPTLPTSNINTISAPNLATVRPHLQPKLPIGLTFANDTTTRPVFYQQTYTKLTTSTPAAMQKLNPVPTALPFLKPQINLKFDIPQFVANLNSSDLAKFNPTVMSMLKYFKEIGTPKQTELKKQNTYSAEPDYESEEIESTTERKRLRIKTPITSTKTSTTTTTTSTTRRPIKGYESFINSIPNKFQPSTTNKYTTATPNTFLNHGEEYYDEYEVAENESQDNDSDDEIHQPSEMPPYMPMSETMAPPRPQMVIPSPATKPSILNHKPAYITGYFEATTTRRPYFNGANLQKFYEPTQNASNHIPPSFISFPTDFFQEIKQRLPHLTESSTSTPIGISTTRPSLKTTTEISTITTTTVKPRYTVRPNPYRGQNKFQKHINKGSEVKNSSSQLSQNSNNINNRTDEIFRKRPISAAIIANLSELNLKANLETGSYRIDSSTSSPSSFQHQTPTSATLFVPPPPRPTKILIENIPSIQTNRNYYNTSTAINKQTLSSSSTTYNNNHDDYDTHLHEQNHNNNHHHHNIQQQGQQQQLQQPELSAQQPEQGSYETYYSVYDDDIDLYRDIDYHQQQQQQQQQQQAPSPPRYQQVQQPIRQPQQSTYRPLDILTTQTPAQQVPIRETSYNKKNQNSAPIDKPKYRNQQALVYNTDYDEDLLAQIEQDNNSYDQPTRSPLRAEQVTIRTLSTLDTTYQSSPKAESLNLVNDSRHYYDTYDTTEVPTVPTTTESPTVYGDKTSVKYNGHENEESTSNDYTLTEQPFTVSSRKTTYAPKSVATQETDEDNLIGSTTQQQLKDTTKTVQLTSNNIRTTTYSPTRNFVSNSKKNYGSTSYTPPSSYYMAMTSRRTTPLTTTSTTTATTTTQATTRTTIKFTITTAAPISKATTSKAPRSKTHANKTHKNQPQKSRTKNPNTTITTSTTSIEAKKFTTPNTQTIQHKPNDSTTPITKTITHTFTNKPNTFKTQNSASLISVAQTRSHSKRVDTTVKPLNLNLQSVKEIENISDESLITANEANQSLESKQLPITTSSSESTSHLDFLDIVEPSIYATNPRGNLVRANTEKPYRGKYRAAELGGSYFDDYSGKNSGEYHSKSTEEKSLKFSDQQRKRIQSFVLSDVEPRSFKPSPFLSSSTEALNQEKASVEIINGDSISSTTTLKYATTSGAQSPKPFRYNFQTGTNGFSLRAVDQSLDYVKNAAETLNPIYERHGSTTPFYTTTVSTTTSKRTTTTTTEPATTTSTTRKPVRVSYSPNTEVIFIDSRQEEIKPTTYAPALRNWRTGRLTSPPITQSSYSSNQQYDSDDHVYSSGNENTVISDTKSLATSTTLKTTTTARFIPTTTTERPVQSFTARASIFKDNLIKTTGTPAQRFVSPYKSLENILQDESFGRTTVKPRYNIVTSTSTSISQTQAKPRGTYFLITTPPKNLSEVMQASVPSLARNYSASDTILSTFSTVTVRPQVSNLHISNSPKTTTSTTTETPASTTAATIVVTLPIRIKKPSTTQTPMSSFFEDYSSSENSRPRGRSRYTAATVASNSLRYDEATTYAPKFRSLESNLPTPSRLPYRRKLQRARVAAIPAQRNTPHLKQREKYQNYKAKFVNLKSIENESVDNGPRAEALIALPLDSKQDNSIESSRITESPDSLGSTEQIVSITDRPLKYLYSNKYRQQTAEHNLADGLQNAGYITSSTGRSAKYRSNSVLEQLQLFLAGDSNESSAQQFVDDFSQPEIKAAVEEIKNLYTTTTTSSPIMSTKSTTTTSMPPTTTTTTTLRTTTTGTPPPTLPYTATQSNTITFRYTPTIQNTIPTTKIPPTTTSTPRTTTTHLSTSTQILSKLPQNPISSSTFMLALPNSTQSTPTAAAAVGITFGRSQSANAATKPSTMPPLIPQRASRVNNAIKSSIAAAASSVASNAARSNKVNNALSATKCSDTTSNAKCNEIPSRTNSNTRNRGSSQNANQDRDLPVTVNSNRGTHPPRTRPTLKPSGTIVSKAQEFVDIYKNPPSRPDPLYPQPTPDKAAAKCRRDVCLLPDCSCGGRDIPGDLPVESVPQIVLITFDDSVNDLNKQLYIDLFEKGRVNPNGCPITATFYVSHEWTDYSQVQNLYSDGHEIASHTVSHSFGEQFSQKKWTREVAGQREILAAYGGVKLSDVRGMRAPFLSVGGNKMYKMLYDSNFTYDSSMPVYENRPPSWPYTLDYKIFHDCMIPPCPTRSYPGVWQVPMVMWQDLNGGRCSMGDACSNPSESDGVFKMIMKNFERHYTTNRAPFGLFYHAAWFTQPHHKEGFIKFLDAINAMPDVWIVTNWQMLQWVRDPTPISRMNSFQPFQCDYSDRPKRCNSSKVCNLWHKSGVRYMKTCQPCPDIYPWTGKTGIRSSRIDNEIEDSTA